uniref:Uncharacterized protein n=1 Tax=Rhizophora mucronata TaxID=61149 RepID=A0A2P2LQ06_RHIMU
MGWNPKRYGKKTWRIKKIEFSTAKNTEAR